MSTEVDSSSPRMTSTRGMAIPGMKELHSNDVRLRDVTGDDLMIFYEHQRDPESTEMAAFPSRGWEDFMAHWSAIRANTAIMVKTIIADRQVAGNVLSFMQGDEREVGYWLGRQYWGKGIATLALAEFLELDPTRPLFARVAKHNIGSRRVLEKCGFAVCGEDIVPSVAGSGDTPEFVMRLDASASGEPA
jgi:RimJ/RimL family protein N-acetyltransferase